MIEFDPRRDERFFGNLFPAGRRRNRLAARARRRKPADRRPLWQGARPSLEALERRVLLSATPTNITVDASASSAVYGQAISRSAYVSASPSAPSVGNVSVFDNGAFLATAPAISGVATFSNIHLLVGAHLISATYSDTSGDFASSTTAVGPNSIISTVAGNGTEGFGGDGGQATAAELDNPAGAAVDSSGHLFIADRFNERIREVNLTTGDISTVAGNGTQGFGGDGG